jgi:hypothetical protein
MGLPAGLRSVTGSFAPCGTALRMIVVPKVGTGPKRYGMVGVMVGCGEGLGVCYSSGVYERKG